MKRVWMVLASIPLCWGIYVCRVSADDTVVAVDQPAVLNDPGNVWGEIKAAVDIINPQGEMVRRFKKGAWEAAVSGSLWDVVSKDYHLGRAKLGYAMSNYGYLGADVDLAGIYGRFASGKLPAVDKLTQVWSKYASTGIHWGRDFEAGEFDYGFTLGVSIPWPVQ